MARKTPWFQSRSARPTRPGVYLTRMHTGNVYWRAFDGKDWHYLPEAATPSTTPTHLNPGYSSLLSPHSLGRDFETASVTHFEWRGLAAPPVLRHDDMDRAFDILRG